MNLEQIIEEINKDVDDTLDNDELTGWVNRCLDDLSPYAQYQMMTTISLVVDQKEYDLPTDYQRLLYLVDNTVPLTQVQMKDFLSCGFKIFGNKLIIQPSPTEEKNLDFYYEAKLPSLTEMTDEPQIPSTFHDLFVLYTVAKRQYQDEEESLQMNAWNEYQSRKQEFISFMAQSSEPTTIEDVSWGG